MYYIDALLNHFQYPQHYQASCGLGSPTINTISNALVHYLEYFEQDLVRAEVVTVFSDVFMILVMVYVCACVDYHSERLVPLIKPLGSWEGRGGGRK